MTLNLFSKRFLNSGNCSCHLMNKKNGLIGPIVSDNNLKGIIIIANKESLSGYIRFNKEDLRLFESLTKKVSLAYENIKLLDSLKKST